jgi:hypothetical protein
MKFKTSQIANVNTKVAVIFLQNVIKFLIDLSMVSKKFIFSKKRKKLASHPVS